MLEVPQPDEGMAGDLEVEIDERNPNRIDERVDGERQDEDYRRRHEQPLEMAVAPLRPGARTGGSRSNLRTFRCGFLCHCDTCRRVGRRRSPGLSPDLSSTSIEFHALAELLDRVVGIGARQLL